MYDCYGAFIIQSNLFNNRLCIQFYELLTFWRNKERRGLKELKKSMVLEILTFHVAKLKYQNRILTFILQLKQLLSQSWRLVTFSSVIFQALIFVLTSPNRDNATWSSMNTFEYKLELARASYLKLKTVKNTNETKTIISFSICYIHLK